ncbi:MAG: tyrosine--tRNA ligase [Chloroflexota bacterium]
MSDILHLLRERGFVQDISDEKALSERLRSPITLYTGYDATAPSLTAGHLVTIMMLAWFQRCGHRPIALMGGGTTMVGDPGGRSSTRPILTVEQIDRNLSSIKEQFSRFLDFSNGKALMINNADWLRELKFVDFMRDVGSRFSVNEVLRLEAYRTRLEAGGMTLLELSYAMMQPYDFVRLNQDYGCILQVGGSDQWGNSVMGADLVRRMTGREAYVLVAPLLLNSDGTKMGKTESGAVFLNISAYDYYQYWRNTDDRAVKRNLATFTFLPMNEVNSLGDAVGSDLNHSKEVLAFEATRILHGERAAHDAQEAAHALFGPGDMTEHVPTTSVERERLEQGIAVTELFKLASLVDSANQARNLIAQGGLAIDGVPVTDARMIVSLEAFQDGHLLLSRGKRNRMRVIHAEP